MDHGQDVIRETTESGLVCLKSRLLDTSAVVDHFLTLRDDGAGSANNMGLHVGNDPDTVIANRRRVLTDHGMSLDRLVVASQVHGDRVSRVSLADGGRGATDHRQAIGGTDALVTDEPGLALMTFFADCVPVFLADRKGRAAGLVHAGWKGVALRNSARTVEAFREHWNIGPEDLLAVIGPAIGHCCFRIRRDVAEALEHACLGACVLRSRDGLRADLPAAVCRTLTDAGVNRDQIRVWPLCTSCGQGPFHSHRRDGVSSGRMAGVIMLK